MDVLPSIQWYPGHIAKLERELQQHLKQLDVVIEVRDARIPAASHHSKLATQWLSQKPVLLVLNKADLADPNWTALWLQHLKQTYSQVLAFDSTSGKGKAQIIEQLVELGEPCFLKLESKGLKRRPLRVGIVGMPNVGKSSLINALVGRKKAQTGHRAGVTRVTKWVRVHPQVELLDTPGLIPPQIDSPEASLLLASVYSVGDAAFQEEEITPFFIEQTEACYPGLLNDVLDLPLNTPPNLEALAKRRGLLLSGGTCDVRRAAQALLKDFRLGRLGRLTLEHPPVTE